MNFSVRLFVRVRKRREYAWGSLQLGVLSIHKLIALASIYHIMMAKFAPKMKFWPISLDTMNYFEILLLFRPKNIIKSA